METTHSPNAGTIVPPPKNLEFAPLSQGPKIEYPMPMNNPVDQIVPEKNTPIPAGHDEDYVVKKDVGSCIPATEEIISTGTKQVKHAKAITTELKLLLEHEQKILQQVITRIDKFKNLRDENKKKATDWENEYKAKLPEYDSYATKLVNVPQGKPITVEGLPAPIQQKILYQIVSKTSNTADRVVVSLSMEQTVANDIDLTLGSLKKQCTVILKRIRGWLKMLDTHECQQNVVMERWDKFRHTLREMKKVSEELRAKTLESMGGGSSATNLARHLAPYEERIKRLEKAVCMIGGINHCLDEHKHLAGQTPVSPGQTPVTPVHGQSPGRTMAAPAPATDDQFDERLRRAEELLTKCCPQLRELCSQQAQPVHHEPHGQPWNNMYSPAPAPAYTQAAVPDITPIYHNPRNETSDESRAIREARLFSLEQCIESLANTSNQHPTSTQAASPLSGGCCGGQYR